MAAVAEVKSVLPVSAEPFDGDLTIAGHSLTALAGRYGTPLYVYDAVTLCRAAEDVLHAFLPLHARVSFAAKACSTPGVLKIFAEAGLGLDVVSAGEMAAGLRAGFPADRLHLHGNCKSRGELEAAVQAGIHAVVLDNLPEIEQLDAICRRYAREIDVMMRLALPIEAATHPHLMTSGRYSKFGFSVEEWGDALRRLAESRRLHLIGVHAHLGSQITETSVYAQAAGELLGYVEEARSAGHPVQEISVGGGWAVAYRPGDAAVSPEEVAEMLRTVVRNADVRLAVEPGRALVARAAVAVYRVGSVKRTDRGRIVAVDGGMGDNPRPAIYGARYTAVSVGAPQGEAEGPADIVGRYCETGDYLVSGVDLPEVGPGDLLAVPVSGAYQLSMASGYNLVPAPAVVLVDESGARLISRRGTIDDLLSREICGCE